MKIAFFTMAFYKGGAERAISTLCNEGLTEGNEVSLVTCIDDEIQYPLNKDVKCYGLCPVEKYKRLGKIFALPMLCKNYVKQMKEINPDIIISFLPLPCFIAGLLRHKVGKVVIGSERSNPYFQYKFIVYRLLAEWLYAKADGFVFQTEGAKEFFNKRIQKNAIVIGNPISIKMLASESKVAKKKEIVSVGRFTKEKNYPMLIKAFAIVQDKYPEYFLKIYGRVDPALGIHAIVKELGLEEKVIFCGQVNDVEEKIRDATVYALSSISEGMPNALMEAMSLGLPVVATDCPSGGPRQLIINGQNGLLVKNDDENDMANAIIKLLENEEYAENLGNNAKKISTDYSPKNICQQWIDYINKVYKEKKQ